MARTLTQTFIALSLSRSPLSFSLYLAQNHTAHNACAPHRGITSINSRPLGAETFGPTGLKVNKTIRALVTLMFQPLSS